MLPTEKKRHLKTIADFPKELRRRVIPLSDEQTRARPLAEEWSVREIVHHCADSHMNSFIRLKLVLTEDNPTVRPYDQDAWVTLADTTVSPLAHSLNMLDGLHSRWVELFSSLDENQWARTGFHPESGVITPDTLLLSYADHCQAHLAQIDRVLAAM